MSVSDNIYIKGEDKKIQGLTEYLNLIGYERVGGKMLGHHIVSVNIADKDYRYSCIIFFNPNEVLDVEKDAEKIDDLVLGPNKALREAKKDYDKECCESPDECFRANSNIKPYQIAFTYNPNKIWYRNNSTDTWNIKHTGIKGFIIDEVEPRSEVKTNAENLNDFINLVNDCTSTAQIKPVNFNTTKDAWEDYVEKKRVEILGKLNNIEVNEPVEIKTEGENSMFKDNQTLGKSQVIEDILGREWVRDIIYTGVWGPWPRGYSVKVTEPAIKEHETLDQILSGNSPKPKLGIKHNQGKLPIDTVLTKQFPKAVKALVECSLYGHEKYKETDKDWLNFKRVPGGSQTYADAAARHNQEKGSRDEESGLLHIQHKLWNVMAEVELWIEEND